MTDNTWKEYFERTKDSKPRPLLVKAVNLVTNKDEALDLGSGALNDVRYLVSVGFKHITAVDSKPIAKDIIKNFPSEIVSYIINTFEDFDFIENKYDLIEKRDFNPQDLKVVLDHSSHELIKTEKGQVVFLETTKSEEEVLNLFKQWKLVNPDLFFSIWKNARKKSI
jgi:hypothetical protein